MVILLALWNLVALLMWLSLDDGFPPGSVQGELPPTLTMYSSVAASKVPIITGSPSRVMVLLVGLNTVACGP